MNKKFFKSAAIIMAIVLMFFFWTQKKENQTDVSTTVTVLKVGYPPVSTALPLFVAIEEGFFDEVNLKIEPIKFTTSNQIVEALVTNKIDATSVSADYPFFLIAQKDNSLFKIYAWEMLDTDIAFDLILAKNGSKITNINDLEGKKVATFPGSQLKHYLKLILDSAGVDSSTVTIIEMPPQNQIPALASGSVDALFTLEPIATIAINKKIAHIISSSPISKYIGNGEPIPAASFAISSDFLEKHKQAGIKFVAAMEKAIDLINKDQKRYRYLYPQFTAIGEDLAQQIPVTKFTTKKDMDISLYQKEANILFEAGLLDKKIDVDSLVFPY